MIQTDADTPANTTTGEQADDRGEDQSTQSAKTKPVVKSDDDPRSTGNSGKPRDTDDKNKQEPAIKGTLKTKIYALKKKTDTKHRSFKCSKCDTLKKSIKELNIHHIENHNPQICGICGKLFKLAMSLARHMYKHNQPRYQCDQCDHSCHFESELNTHKIIHRKNPSHQCMKGNCGKWFR